MAIRSAGFPLTVAAASAISLCAMAAFAPKQQPGGFGPGGPGQGPGGPGFGPGGPGQGPGGPGFGPGMFLAPVVIERADADGDGALTAEEAAEAARKIVKEADKDGKGSIDGAALGRVINRLMPAPPGFGPPEGEGAGPEGEPEFGPGMFFGQMILGAADGDKDGRLTPDEAAKAAESFVTSSLGEGKKPLDESQLAQAINRRMGPPGGFGGPGGGGPGGEERKLVKAHDRDGDGQLNAEERQEAREAVKKQQEQGGGGFPGPGGFGGPGGPGGPGGRRGGFGPPGFGGEEQGPAEPGAKLAPKDVESFEGKSLYDPTIIRTLFLDFESEGWEEEMGDFYKSDVEIPAKLTVDGKEYPGVGVHFRGMSSYFTVPKGRKRSLNVSIDHTDGELRLDGYKTLNLLNAHEDSSFLHTVLYSEIARQYMPAPKANFVRVVINGESWGLYVNTQQFDKKFLDENFGTDKGARWKVPGNPGADGGLRYLGEDLAEYKRRYQIKSSDDPDDWKAFITLCKTLEETPIEGLPKAIEPILDVDGVLKFLALENALVNGDGYWVRASDYSIYLDPKGQFHILPHDMNEVFQPAMMFGPGGPGGFGGPGRGGPGGGGPGGPRPQGGQPGAQQKGANPQRGGFGGFGGRGGAPSAPDLDPLVGLDDTRKPLRSRLLAVPEYKERYLGYVREIAEKSLDWKNLGPIVAGYRELIEEDVKADTKKLSSLEAFQAATADEPAAANAAPAPGRGRPSMSLRAFADARRKYLLEHTTAPGSKPTASPEGGAARP